MKELKMLKIVLSVFKSMAGVKFSMPSRSFQVIAIKLA